MTKTFSQMTEHERQKNRARIRRGEAADYEADAADHQTPESIARDLARRQVVEMKAVGKHLSKGPKNDR